MWTNENKCYTETMFKWIQSIWNWNQWNSSWFKWRQSKCKCYRKNFNIVPITGIIPYSPRNQSNHENDYEHRNPDPFCGICNSDTIYPAIILPCSHTGFCRRCLKKIFFTYLCCPYCRQQVTAIQRFIILVF